MASWTWVEAVTLLDLLLAPSEPESMSPVMLRLSSEGDPLDPLLLGRLCAFCGGVGAMRPRSTSPSGTAPGSCACSTGLPPLLQAGGSSLGTALLLPEDQRSTGPALTTVCTDSLLLLAWTWGCARASLHSALQGISSHLSLLVGSVMGPVMVH